MIYLLYIKEIFIYKCNVPLIRGDILIDKSKKGRRNKSEWGGMGAAELTRLMAHRIARIEILKMEIKELQKLIDKKMR